MKKKTLGIILSVIFTLIFFGFLIYDSGLIPVLQSIAVTAFIAGGGGLCVWLLTEEDT